MTAVGFHKYTILSGIYIPAYSCHIYKIHGRLELFHGENSHGLRCWLRLEHARLLREWIHTLASCSRFLFLQLEVDGTSYLERAILFELVRCHNHHSLKGTLHVLPLQAYLLCDGAAH